MTNANVMLALEELQREYADVGEQVERLQRDLSALERRHSRLGEAIESLERLNEPSQERAPEVGVPVIRTDTGPRDILEGVLDRPRPTLRDDVVNGPSVPTDSPIANYIKGGGQGRRLSSTLMVRDVVQELDKVVTREELREAFFRKFSREVMEGFWKRPDNAFGTAVGRAVQDKLIEVGSQEDGTEVYGSHAVAERLAQEAASSEPEVKDDETR